ncbi:MAG: hypothetical protein ACPGFA_01805 [Pikeienuella sp.]
MPPDTLALTDIEPTIETADVDGAMLCVRCDRCRDRWSIRVDAWPDATGQHPSFSDWLTARTCTGCGNGRLQLERLRDPHTGSPIVYRATPFLSLFSGRKTAAPRRS